MLKVEENLFIAVQYLILRSVYIPCNQIRMQFEPFVCRCDERVHYLNKIRRKTASMSKDYPYINEMFDKQSTFDLSVNIKLAEIGWIKETLLSTVMYYFCGRAFRKVGRWALHF